MARQYYGILTTKGRALYANALLLNQDVNLSEMAIDDTVNFLPDEKLESLPSEVYRAELNSLEKDDDNDEMVIAELVIPSQRGGFYCRGFGLYTDTGILFAVGSLAETYKATEDEGSGGELVIQADIVVTNTAALVLKVDPTTVLATRETVDRAIAAHEAKLDPHPQYAPKNSPTLTGIPKAPTPAAGNNTTQIATTAFVQAIATALNTALALKAPLASPGLTGIPTAPTAAQSTNNTQIATTAFVKSAIAALVASSPAALDTLNELAAALGNDPNFATTVTNALAGKQPLDNTLTALSGKSVSALLEYLGLGEGSALPVGVPVLWPLATPPTGWLKYNGAAFDKSKYPKLAAVYPSGVLLDLRGYFVRGWDDGRGIDTSRALLSLQASMSHDHYHVLPTTQGTGGDGLMSAIFRDYTDALLYYPDGTNDYNPTPSTGTVLRTYTAKASFGAILGNESRPGNIAFNYIVRAA